MYLTKPVLCQYEFYDGIHYLTVGKPTPEAIDLYFAYLRQLQLENVNFEPFRLITQTNLDNLPIAYIMNKIRLLNEAGSDRPPSRHLVFYEYGRMVELLRQVISALTLPKRDKVRFCPLHDNSIGLSWLLGE